MRKLKLSLLVVVVTLAATMFLAACGHSIPSWAIEPSTPQQFVIDARANGFEAFYESGEDLNFGIAGVVGFANANNASIDIFAENFDFESIADDTVIWMESITVFWFSNQTYRDARFLVMEASHEAELALIPDGMTATAEIVRFGYTITSFSRMEGPLSAFLQIFGE